MWTISHHSKHLPDLKWKVPLKILLSWLSEFFYFFKSRHNVEYICLVQLSIIRLGNSIRNNFNQIVSNLNLQDWVMDPVSNIKCYQCGKQLLNKNCLRMHLKIHAVNRPKFKCTFEQCSMNYTSKPSLNHHIQKVHLGTFKRIGCNFCNSTFTVTLDYSIKYGNWIEFVF